MAGKSASILVRVLGEDSGFSKVMAASERKLAAFQTKAAAVGTKLRDVGQKMTLGITVPVLAAGGAAFKMAADLQDAMGATTQIYGKAGDTVKKWAQSLPSYYGIARGEAHEYANMMGAMLTNIGKLSQEESAATSAKLVELAGDLTAMFGGTTESAVQALTGALKGNTTMLDNYGMSATDAQQKAKALEMGIYDGTGALDAQTKQAAILALVMEQSSAAQGQAAREAKGASGQMRALQTDLKNMATEIGTKLLPVGVKLLGFVGKLMDGFKGLSPAAQRVIMIAAGIAAAIGPVIFIVGALSTAIGFLVSPIGLAIVAVAAIAAAFAIAYKRFEPFRQMVDRIVSAVRDGLLYAFNEFRGGLRAFMSAWHAMDGDVTSSGFPGFMERLAFILHTFANRAVPVIRRGLENFVAGFRVVVAFVQAAIPVIVAAFQSFVGWLQRNVFPVLTALADFFVAAFNRVSAIVGAVLPVVIAIIQGFVSFLEPVWSRVWGVVVAVVTAVWNTIRTVVETVLGVVRGIIQTVTGIISGDWSKVWQGIRTVASSVWNGIVGVIRTAINLVRSVVGSVLGAIGGLFANTWNAIRSGASSAINGVVGFFTGLPGRLLGVIGAVGSAAASIGSAIASKIGEGIGNIVSGVGDIATKMWNGLKGFINEKIIDKINNFSVNVPILGKIEFPNLPRLHSGGYAGLKRNEVPAILEAGESVRTRRQEAELQRILANAKALQGGGGAGGGVHLHFHGPVAGRDGERWIAETVEKAVNKGHRMPKLKEALTG